MHLHNFSKLTPGGNSTENASDFHLPLRPPSSAPSVLRYYTKDVTTDDWMDVDARLLGQQRSAAQIGYFQLFSETNAHAQRLRLNRKTSEAVVLCYPIVQSPSAKTAELAPSRALRSRGHCAGCSAEAAAGAGLQSIQLPVNHGARSVA